MQPGQFKPGSASSQIMGLVNAAGGEPVLRAALREGLDLNNRKFFNRTLDRLVVQGLLRETADGFLPAMLGRATSAIEAPALEPVPDCLAACLAEIVRRAHHHREAGAPTLAASLLQRAAQKLVAPHLRQNLLALSDLFAAHGATYPNGRAA
ncbi:hypothetical protein LJR009_001619 [Bosea sp. LjRoot9]|uniref:hypothetical protein n=1 Tax=Bosea sp. LjRoot9 TaxID=3342341 RepID=UPI003ED04B6B